MNKIFSSRQIAVIDQYTISNEPISHIDLMERASKQLAKWISIHIAPSRIIYFFIGPGNNGGDAMAVARLLADQNYLCRLFYVENGKGMRDSPAINFNRLKAQAKVAIIPISGEGDFPHIPDEAIIVDGLFGSGLTRPLGGIYEALVKHINQAGAEIIAIDIPSGLFAEDNDENSISRAVKANFTLTLQFPKLSFFFAEHEKLIGKWEVLPIGLHPEIIDELETEHYYLDDAMVASIRKDRSRFAHKGTFGHALLIAGAYGKMGAAVMAAKSCLRSGVGLLTSHVPHSGTPILQVAVPEAMCSIDASDLMFTEFPALEQFSAVGVGPGIGTKPNSHKALHALLTSAPEALVLDADAINILAAHPEWYELLPANTILTPHPKEFSRLVGESADSFLRLKKQREFSRKYGVIVVLKGAYTSVSLPDGKIIFNTTGNPGMATAGSGDVLTGIITGLLAQPYSAEEAALLGVFIHGRAGDLAVQDLSPEGMLAGDITAYLGKAFLSLPKKA